MTDRLSTDRRSWLMSRVSSKDTAPEIRVRSAAHRRGLRFRIHRRDLPGSPDLVFPKRRLAIFVHGCFWHRHPGCRKASTPKSNIAFWQKKFAQNIERDELSRRKLQSLGWQVLTIWECETKREDTLYTFLKEIEKYGN
ncbi:very short patch repair endonuclease [Aurantimonas marina]|uniref:very short patch repair endonuclease n=1 Tax=Aurantimonas marina TaxID=2780508 RepID=UPI0019D0BF21|nr:DNA mismatch endonuclease Vsr [Aurantimonas marina]